MARQLRTAGYLLIAFLSSTAALSGQTAQSEPVQTGVVLSGDEATLELELDDGRSLRVRLIDGRVLVGGKEVGSYQPGGALESSWRALLRGAVGGELARDWVDFSNADYGAEASVAAVIRDALAPLVSNAAAPAAPQQVSVAEAMAAAGAKELATATALATAEGSISVQAGEVVSGGLVIELADTDGLMRSLGRIGLAPELARALNGDLTAPVRIVLEADQYQLLEGTTLEKTLILVETDGIIAGTVNGNVIVAEGALLIRPNGRIDGDVVALNASVQNQGTISGGLREAAHLGPVVVAPAVQRIRIESPSASVLSNVWRGLGSLTQTIAMYLFFAFLGALTVYFFRGHLEAVSDTVSYSFGRSFLAGLSAEVLFLPIALVLLVLVITAIAIPFYAIGFLVAALLGYLAVAHAAGENLTRHRFPSWASRARRSNSYYYVLNGLGVLLALFVGAAVTDMAYPLLGWAHDLLIASAWILTWVASTAGLGAALLSRGGTRRSYARPQQLPPRAFDTLAEEMAPIERRAESRRPAGKRSDEI